MPSIKSLTHAWITFNHSNKAILQFESYLDAEHMCLNSTGNDF
jgi:hypothetical protein